MDSTKTAQSRSVVLERVAYDPVRWAGIIAGYPEAEVFHSPEWLAFLVASQGVEPVVAIVREDGRAVGYFLGAIARRLGVRILGSPLRGWGTQCMGFLLDPGADRRAAAEALVPFAFDALRCLHVELSDRSLMADQMAGSGFLAEHGRTIHVALDDSEEAIQGAMRSTTRNYIRQAGRKGLLAEAVDDPAFAGEYHRQLTEVFARQGLAPTYGIERVRQLIGALRSSDQIVTIRVSTAEGEGLATAIAVGRGRTAVLWGAAFHRSRADLHPNELLHWSAMRTWRAKGAVRYDMGGGGEYKAKYGGVEIPTVHFHRSRYALMGHGRAAIRGLVKSRQKLVGVRRALTTTRRS
jgi:CelD/BcsL family acetyltransferase involved in cellulose biosynthesis